MTVPASSPAPSGASADHVPDLPPDDQFAQDLGIDLDELNADETGDDDELLGDPEGEGEDEGAEEKPAEKAEAKGEDAEEEESAEEEAEAKAKDEEADADEAGEEGGKEGRPAFKLLDTTDGAELEAPETARLEFKVNGKIVKKRLDQVVRMAQQGGAAMEGMEELQRLRPVVQQVETLTGNLTQLQQELAQQKALNRTLLEDDEKADAIRQQWREANTPEKRAERAEQALLAERNGRVTEKEQASRVTFLQTQLQPALEKILEEHPTVEWEELYGLWTLASDPFRKNGVVSTENLPKTLEVLYTTVLPTVVQRHQKRSTATTEKVVEAEKKVEKEKKETATVKRMLARRIAPTSAPRGGSATTAGKNRPGPQSLREGEARVDADLRDYVRGAVS